MSVADYVALASAIAGVVTAVTALVKVLQHNRDTSAHGGKTPNPPQA